MLFIICREYIAGGLKVLQTVLYLIKINMSDHSSQKEGTMLVDDLVNATSEWRHIEGIIRLTFKAMSDVLFTQ